MTQYFVAMNGIKVPKVLEATAEKKLTKMSGSFSSRVIDRENTLYDTTTSGDEFEIIQNNEESESELQSNYTDTVAINWYKFNNDLTDSSGATTPVVKTRATAYYPFNGNANDESTSGNNGTVTGATLTTDRFGEADKAYSFDGGDYIAIGDVIPNTLVTFSAWIQSTDTDLRTIGARGGSGESVETNVQQFGTYGNNNLWYKTEIGAGADHVIQSTTTTNVIDGNWHHVVWVVNTTILTVYVDGVLEDTQTIVNTDSTCPFCWIGSYYAGTANSWVGKIDEVIILPIALSDNEVYELYQTSGGRDVFLKNNCLIYYPLDGNSNDASGKANTGTVTGAILTTDRFGNENSAYYFDGSAQSITSTASIAPSGAETASFYIIAKFDDYSQNHNLFYKGLGDGLYPRLFYQQSSDSLWAQYRLDGSSHVATVTNFSVTYPAGIYHHYIMVLDKNVGVKIYIDGILVGQSLITGTLYDGGVNSVSLGRDVNLNYNLKGTIDTFVVLSYALTQSQVTAIYNATLTSDFEFTAHDWNNVLINNGKFSGCADFGAINNYGPYIEIEGVELIATQSKSISAWVYLNTTWEASGAVFGGRRGDVTSFVVDVNRKLECREDDYQINSVSTIPLETWTHIVYTFKWGGTGLPGTMSCYINGVLDYSMTKNHTESFTTSTVWIGWESRFNYHFNGKIDDVRFFNKELSQTEISEIYGNYIETKVFGGIIENVTRDQRRNYLLTVKGGDYTSKLNQITVNVQAYDDREYSVIVRDLMHTYLMKAKVIDDFEATTGWTAAGDFGSLSLQTGTDGDGHKYARIGDGAVQLLANYSSGTGTLTRTFATTKDFLATDYVSLYIYVDNVTKLGTNYRLKLGQDASNYYLVTKASSTLVTGWNYVEFDLATATETGSPALANIDYYQFSFDVVSGASNVTLMFDDLRRTPHGDFDYTVSNVDFTPYYTTILFKNITVHEAIKKIANIRPTKYDFFVDIYKVLDFSVMGTQSSGVTLQKGVNILSSNFADDDTNLCNSVTVYGGRQQFSYEETFNGDGSELNFTVTYEPVDAYVLVSGAKKLGYQEGMTASSFDYKIDQKNRKIIFQTGKAPAVGVNNVVIRYTYSVPIIVKNEDFPSIANYKLRSKKIENPQLLTKEDVQAVASDYITKWKEPIINGNVVGKIEPLVDVGETIQYIDTRIFPTEQTFVVAGIKQNFIGSRLNTTYTLTSYQTDLEQYLNDLFDRLNALEEKEKGQSEVVSQLFTFLDNLGITDDPENNLVIKFKNIAGDTLIWGSADFGIWGVFKWGSETSSSFVLGLSKLGVSALGSVTSDWGNNVIENPSD